MLMIESVLEVFVGLVVVISSIIATIFVVLSVVISLTVNTMLPYPTSQMHSRRGLLRRPTV